MTPPAPISDRFAGQGTALSRMYDRRHALGLCVRCKNRKEDKKKRHCDTCLLEVGRAMKALYEKRKAAKQGVQDVINGRKPEAN